MSTKDKDDTVVAINGCSGRVTWFYRKILGRTPSWNWVCNEHDVAYAEGITSKHRKTADKRLKSGLLSAMSNRRKRAYLFYWAVRIFGWIPFHLEPILNDRDPDDMDLIELELRNGLGY